MIVDRQEAELEATLFGTADAIEGFGLEAAAPAPVWLDDNDEAAPDEAPSAAVAGGAVALWEDRRGDARAAGWAVLCVCAHVWFNAAWASAKHHTLQCSIAWTNYVSQQVGDMPSALGFPFTTVR